MKWYLLHNRVKKSQQGIIGLKCQYQVLSCIKLDELVSGIFSL